MRGVKLSKKSLAIFLVVAVLVSVLFANMLFANAEEPTPTTTEEPTPTTTVPAEEPSGNLLAGLMNEYKTFSGEEAKDLIGTWKSWNSNPALVTNDRVAKTFSLDSSVKYNGMNSYKIDNITPVDGKTPGANTGVDTGFTIQGGKTYTISLVAKTTEMGGEDLSSGFYATLTLYPESAKNKSIWVYSQDAIEGLKEVYLTTPAGGKYIADNRDWTLFSYTFDAPENANFGVLTIKLWNNTGIAYVSDIQLYEGRPSEPGDDTDPTDDDDYNDPGDDDYYDDPDDDYSDNPSTTTGGSPSTPAKQVDTSDSTPYMMLFTVFLISLAVSVGTAKGRKFVNFLLNN